MNTELANWRLKTTAEAFGEAVVRKAFLDALSYYDTKMSEVSTRQSNRKFSVLSLLIN